MFRLKRCSDFACFSASGSLLNTVAPENLNVHFPWLSYTLTCPPNDVTVVHRRNPTAVRHRLDSENEHSAVTAMVQTVILQC